MVKIRENSVNLIREAVVSAGPETTKTMWGGEEGLHRLDLKSLTANKSVFWENRTSG